MFILTAIAINSSLTSKRAHVCIPTMIVTSLEISRDSVFPLIALIGFLNVREKEKGLKPSFYCLRAVSISPSRDVIFQIPTVKM